MILDMVMSYRIGDVFRWQTNLGVDDAVIIGNLLKANQEIVSYRLEYMSTENMYKQHNQEQLEEELKMIRLNIESRRNV